MNTSYYQQRRVRRDQTVSFNGKRYPAEFAAGMVALILPMPNSNAIALKAANAPANQTPIYPI